MYIRIINIAGEKTIYLSYPIRNFTSNKEIAVVSMFSDNIQYEMKEPLELKLIGNDEKQIPNGAYALRELSALVEGKFILTDLGSDPRVTKKNKLAKVTDMIFNLDKLNNSNNLKDRRPSNTIFTYYVLGFVNFMHFEPNIS